MSAAVLDLNDAGLEIVGKEGLLAVSPGYAVLHQGRLLLGEEARQSSRRWPGWTSNRFWNQLSLARLPNGTDQLRSFGDLAYLHLQDLWQQLENQPEELILAVPGSMEKEQLSLLLGIAEECGLPVAGLVNSKLAAVSGQPVLGQSLHLDLDLHQVILTRFNCDTRLEVSETRILADLGLHSLMDSWCSLVAERIIQTSRFDPMHDAESEQALYNQVGSWIQSGRQRGALRLVFARQELEPGLSEEALKRAAAGFYTQLVQQLRGLVPARGRVRLHISHRWQDLPGLMESLSLLPQLELVMLAQSAVYQGVCDHLPQIQSTAGQHRLITALKTRQPLLPEDPVKTPGHYLVQGIARPVGDGVHLDANLSPCSEKEARVTLLRNGQQLEATGQGEGVTLNGKALAKQSLAAGDSIAVDGQQLMLIHVSEQPAAGQAQERS